MASDKSDENKLFSERIEGSVQPKESLVSNNMFYQNETNQRKRIE